MSRVFAPVFLLLPLLTLSRLPAHSESLLTRVVAAASSPRAVAAADFNGDGVSDTAVADGAGVIQIVVNGADGSSHATGIYSIGGPAAALIAGDFDRDGKTDLIAASSAGALYFLRGLGDGSFASPVTAGRLEAGVAALAAADFNEDGDLDLAAASSTGTLRVFTGRGDGSFTAAATYATGAPITALAAAPLSSAHADLALATSAGVVLRPGNGDGTFGKSQALLPEGAIAGFTAVRFDAAARASLIVSEASGALVVLDGLSVTARLAANAGAVAAAPSGEILLGDASNTQIRVYTRRSDGTLGSPEVYDAGMAVTALAASASGPFLASFAGERAGIVAVLGAAAPSESSNLTTSTRSASASQSMAVESARILAQNASQVATSSTLRATPNPATFGKIVTLTATVAPAAATGRFTFYDGTIVLGSAPVSSGAAVLNTVTLRAGARSLSARYDGDANDLPSTSAALPVTISDVTPSGYPTFQSYAAGTGPNSVAVGDFNGDGYQDLAVVNTASNTVSSFLGGGGGNFTLVATVGAGASPQSVAVADFNSDGIPDLVVSSANGVSLLLGNGLGSFTSVGAYPANVEPAGIAIGDLNKDGIPDVVVSNSQNVNVSILFGNGAGGFLPTVNIPTNNPNQTGTNAIAIADFNNDGNPDIAAVDTTSAIVYLFLGNGDGTFKAPAALNVGSNPADIAAADLNGDGIADLVIPDSLSDTLLVLIGSGGGAFHAAVSYPTGTLPSAVAVADFNGDGRPDIAIVNAADATAGVYINSGTGTFAPAAIYPPTSPGGFLVGLAVGEFNGDGAPDIALADAGNFAGSPGELGVLLSGGGAGGPGCTYSVNPTSLAYDERGSTASVTLTASSPSCSWQASSNATWIVPGVTSGTGTTAVTVAIAANTTGIERTGTLTIAGIAIPVTEWGTTQVFSDVPPTDYYFDAVNLLYAKGITTGCAVSEYCPSSAVTRAQMAIFIVRAVYNGSNDFSYNPVPYFTDVPPSAFGFQWIQKLYELGITTGCGVNLYCPNNPVTRDQMAVFIVRARFGATYAFDYPGAPYFTDVPSSYWAFPWIQRLRFDNITTGCTATQYCPTNAVIRGDMALFIMRGEFNQLLPAGTPVIVSVSPTTILPGQTASFTVTGANTNFAQNATTVAAIPGEFTVNSVAVENATTLVVGITAAASAPAQPVSIFVKTSTVEAILPNGLTIQ